MPDPDTHFFDVSNISLSIAPVKGIIIGACQRDITKKVTSFRGYVTLQRINRFVDTTPLFVGPEENFIIEGVCCKYHHFI